MATFNELSSDDKLIILSSKLFPDIDDVLQIDQLIPKITDWNSFVDIVICNGIAPVVRKNLTASKNVCKIPESIISRLNQVYFKILSRNILLTTHFKNIIAAFSEKNIEVIALKGMYLSELIYQNIGLRPMSDIDLLVKKTDAETCRDILLKLGHTDQEVTPSELIKETEKHFAPLVKDNISVEIHHKLHNEQYGYTINTDDFWKNANPVFLHGVSSLALSPNDLLIHLCIHLDSHNAISNIQLRHISDIVNILEFFKDKLDWQKFENSCVQNNCSQNVFGNLLLIKKYYNAQIPENIIQRNKHYSNALTEEIFINTLGNNEEEIERKKRDFMAERNLQNLKRVKGFRNKMFYLLGDMFPKKEFMYQNYKIKNKKLLCFYYLKRLSIGFVKMLMVIKKKIFKPKKKSETIFIKS